jgi:hypothetical protein
MAKMEEPKVSSGVESTSFTKQAVYQERGSERDSRKKEYVSPPLSNQKAAFISWLINHHGAS